MVNAEIWNAMEAECGSTSSGEVRSSALSVDTSLSIADMTPRIVELCRDLFKNWSTLDNSHFAVDTMSGGITNLCKCSGCRNLSIFHGQHFVVLKVTVQEGNGNEVSVAVRLYGPNTDYVINRGREMQAMKYISAAGFGAKLLGTFGNGMVQSFLDARTLNPEDMRSPQLAAEVAKQLHRFHKVEVPGSREPQLWSDIAKFFKTASDLSFEDDDKQKKYKTISFSEFLDDVNELKEVAVPLNSPVVFAHNDLLSGNLMLNEKHGKLYFIDFEYGSYNYRGFDIGNHFNEYAGYDCDYTRYPTKEEQYHFFRNYLKPDSPTEVPETDLEALYIETNTFKLASHLCWALWGLIQAKMSPIDFDYLGYFFQRYAEYKIQKGAALSLARSYLTKSGSRLKIV